MACRCRKRRTRTTAFEPPCRARRSVPCWQRAQAVDYPNFKATLPHHTPVDRAPAMAYTRAHAALEAAQQAALAGPGPPGD
jgi:hypothetical protein